MTGMRVGVLFPNAAAQSDPQAVRDLAQSVEGLGFSHLTVYDHVLGVQHADRTPPLKGPYTELDPFHEPLVLMGFLAACTSTIELGTGVLILSQRQTALVAKQVAELQILSGGRIRLGVGTGWNHVEYESLGVPWGGRGARFEEQIEVLRRLWHQPLVDFSGRFHRIDRAGLLPRPGSPVPLWFGGHSAAQQDRAARLADGFLWQFPSSYAVRGIDRMRRAAQESGRQQDSIGFDALIDGTAEDTADQIGEWAAGGGTHATLTFDNCTLEQTLHALSRVAGTCAMSSSGS